MSQPYLEFPRMKAFTANTRKKKKKKKEKKKVKNSLKVT